jgi:MarR family multiple antibiotic resistance transcriptional regulator
MPEGKSLTSLFKLVHSLKQNMQKQIEALDLGISPMHVRVFKIIANKPECSAVDIVRFLGRDKAQITRLLNGLIEQGLIIKVPNPKDKRSQCLRVSEQGQTIMAKIARLDQATLLKIKQGVSDEELETFQKIADKIAANLKG